MCPKCVGVLMENHCLGCHKLDPEKSKWCCNDCYISKCEMCEAGDTEKVGKLCDDCAMPVLKPGTGNLEWLECIKCQKEYICEFQ